MEDPIRSAVAELLAPAVIEVFGRALLPVWSDRTRVFGLGPEFELRSAGRFVDALPGSPAGTSEEDAGFKSWDDLTVAGELLAAEAGGRAD